LPNRASDKTTLGLRPQELRLSSAGPGPDVTIELIEDLGASRLLHTRLGDDTPIVIEAFDRQAASLGQRLKLDVSQASAHFFDATGERI
jgi:ABC-type sugar transport system ATPase subunit